MSFDPLLLSRIQFGWVMSWHIVLLAFTIGTGCYVVLMEGLFLACRREAFRRVATLWTRIFAVGLGMGMVSGVIMPLQLGTNWSRFSSATANILGPLLGYEGLMAFFLEATFLAVLLFGRKLVPPSLHFLAAVMVVAGTILSAFWLLAIDSWTQTPDGFVVSPDGRFFPADWLSLIVNPSFPYRLAHALAAFQIAAAFVVLGVGAHSLRHATFPDEGRIMMTSALAQLSVLVPLQMAIGEQHVLNLEHSQPATFAAIDGRWEAEPPAPSILFAWPDELGQRSLASAELPKLASLTQSLDADVRGLKEWPADQRPPATVVFFAFRLMVGLGLAMLGIVLWGWRLALARRLYDSPLFGRFCQWIMPIGFLAILAGWMVSDMGRQPWSVYGLLRTEDSLSPDLTGPGTLVSLTVYIAAYLALCLVGVRIIASLVRQGPEAAPGEHFVDSLLN